MKTREKCMEIYTEAFGSDAEFDELLFDCFFDCCVTLEKEGETVSMMFVIPCELKKGAESIPAAYVYAVATSKQHRGKGYMTELMDIVRRDEDRVLFLKPVRKSLETFYSGLGFKKVSATGKSDGNITVQASEKHKKLSSMCEKAPDEFTLMYSGKHISQSDKISFPFLME